MLRTLKIENIAVIEKAEINFGYGFNCLTGETGAGKSILIDSINAVLGSKTSRDLIRNGQTKASVTAVFDFPEEQIKFLLSYAGVDADTDALILSRVMTADGRNTCRINGEPVNVGTLKRIGTKIVSIHGQSDNQELMNVDNHLSFVDMFASDEDLLSDYRKSFNKLKDIAKQIKRLTISESEKERKKEMLCFQIDEIQKAEIKPGEIEKLEKKKKTAENYASLNSMLKEAESDVIGDEENSGAADLISDCLKCLQKASEINSDIKNLSDSAQDIYFNISDLGSRISSLLSDFEENSYEDINYINDRLNLLYTITSKYGGSEENTLEFLETANSELDLIENNDETIAKLNSEFAEKKSETLNLAYKMSSERKKYASVLEKRIDSELADLNMSDAKFFVNFKEKKYSSDGIDEVEFFIKTNKGETAKPLVKTASGGELSRIMLAMKNVFVGKSPVDTLIFDEIDSGVSGKAAEKIAEKLYSVSKNCQVICITHLPSIASFADTQFRISKYTDSDRTFTKVEPLDFDGRKHEIARLIGGDENDSVHLMSAEKLLSDAQNYKNNYSNR